jgi:hypothetical protein
MVRNNNSLAASRCRLNQLGPPRKWASSHFMYGARPRAHDETGGRRECQLLCSVHALARRMKEHFELRSQRVRHLRRQRSGRASARSALPPINGHRQCDASCTRSANSVIWHRSKTGRTRITSSARASSVSGTVRPSALAVLRLITSSNLVGC